MTASDVQLLVTPKAKRLEIAEAYAELLMSNWSQLGELDVAALNEAIVNRWSLSGLVWIKERAWKIAQTPL